MAINLSGADLLPKGGKVMINIMDTHPLLQLVRILPWALLLDLVVCDLKSTTPKGFWWMGRRIMVRIHLGAYLLQRIYNLTDRKTEYQMRDNAAFQLFCGYGIVDHWHIPDHTKIQEFRSRLSEETQRKLANLTAQAAVSLGFADPREVDFDSTVQEANISYPSDASLMTKLGSMCKKFIEFMSKKSPLSKAQEIYVDLKNIKTKAREYFFLAKNRGIEVKRGIFKQLHKLVKQQLRPVIAFSQTISKKEALNLPWNIQRIYRQIKNNARRYLLDVGHFTRTHAIKVGKLLSFHASQVACIKKNKAYKKMEFGRVFQLGRIKGNFLFVLKSTSVRMEDKHSFIPLVKEHQKLFGNGILENLATDKGYWSDKNRKMILQMGKTTAGIQKPFTVKEIEKDLSQQEHLRNRRAGIEPLIGHAKHGGQLGKSRMRSDKATLAAGYGSILGLNLRQLIRHQQGKMKKAS